MAGNFVKSHSRDLHLNGLVSAWHGKTTNAYVHVPVHWKSRNAWSWGSYYYTSGLIRWETYLGKYCMICEHRDGSFLNGCFDIFQTVWICNLAHREQSHVNLRQRHFSVTVTVVATQKQTTTQHSLFIYTTARRFISSTRWAVINDTCFISILSYLRPLLNINICPINPYVCANIYIYKCNLDVRNFPKRTGNTTCALLHCGIGHDQRMIVSALVLTSNFAWYHVLHLTFWSWKN